MKRPIPLPAPRLEVIQAPPRRPKISTWALAYIAVALCFGYLWGSNTRMSIVEDLGYADGFEAGAASARPDAYAEGYADGLVLGYELHLEGRHRLPLDQERF